MNSKIRDAHVEWWITEGNESIKQICPKSEFGNPSSENRIPKELRIPNRRAKDTACKRICFGFLSEFGIRFSFSDFAALRFRLDPRVNSRRAWLTSDDVEQRNAEQRHA
jgi:hypothetical protein